LKGLRLSSATRTNGEITERLGATVVSITNPEGYGALQRNMVQGLLLPFSGALTFHLQEGTKYHGQGLPRGCTTAAVCMNKGLYANLPADLRAVIDAASGDAMAQHMRNAAASEERVAVEKVAAFPGAVLVKLEPAETARWRERLKPMSEEWVK